MQPSSYHTNMQASRANVDFRHVLYDGRHLQLIVMSVPPGGEIGEEVHDEHDQLFLFAEGEGKMVVGAEKLPVHAGDIIVVPAGVYHNLKNLGPIALKLFTCFAPPHYPPGSIIKIREE